MAKRWSSEAGAGRPGYRRVRASRSGPAIDGRAAGPGGYAEESRRPLPILIYLLPLIVLYDLGAWFFLSRGGPSEVAIRAYRLLEDFLSVFGAVGAHLPAVLLIVVLLGWHVMRRDRWRVRLQTVGLMHAEAAAWSLPLLVLVMFIGAQVPLAAEVGEGSLGARLTIAIGAGIYEELLFRLLVLEVATIALRDLLRLGVTPSGRRWCRVGAAAVSAGLFTLYHDAWTDSMAVAATYFAAGLFFAGLYELRGLGIVVGAHAVYDVVVLVLLR